MQCVTNSGKHGYVQLDANKSDEALCHRRRNFVIFCGILSAGVVVAVCKTAQHQQVQDSDIAMAAQSLGLARQMHQPVKPWQFTQPARARQFAQQGRAQQFTQPARVWQSMQPSSGRQFLQAVHAATIDASVTTDLEAKKAAVFSALEIGSDPAVRSALSTALPQLEASNPTPEPALSQLITGTWTVKYTGAVAKGPVDSPTREIALLMYAAGFSPGVAALSLANRLPDNLVQVKMVQLKIPSLPGESTATMGLVLGGQTNANVELNCELVATGPAKLTETGKEVIYDGGSPVQVPEQLQYSRDLVVTYIDDQLLVVRDATGSPDILIRESAPPSIATPTEQELPPGMIEGDLTAVNTPDPALTN